MQEIFLDYFLTKELSHKKSRHTYLASPRQDAQQKLVIKIFDQDCVNPAQHQGNRLAHADILLSIRHPHIIPLQDIAIQQGQLYVVSEYRPHGSLSQRLERLSPERMDWPEAVSIIMQIGQALDYAHEQRIIHGNLKPANVFYHANGEIQLTDFSLTSLIDVAKLDYKSDLSTIRYMAPEQFMGKTDQQSDQYNLACLAYELITGKVPFDAAGFSSMWGKHATEYAPPLASSVPKIPMPIDLAVLKALAKKPHDRYENIAAFLAALERGLSTQVASPPLSRLYSSASNNVDNFPLSSQHGNTVLPTHQTSSAGNTILPAYPTSSAGNTILPAQQASSAGNTILPTYPTSSAGNTILPTHQTSSAGNTILPTHSTSSAGNTRPLSPQASSAGNTILPTYPTSSAGNTFLPAQQASSAGNTILPTHPTSRVGNTRPLPPLSSGPDISSLENPLATSPLSPQANISESRSTLESMTPAHNKLDYPPTNQDVLPTFYEAGQHVANIPYQSEEANILQVAAQTTASMHTLPPTQLSQPRKRKKAAVLWMSAVSLAIILVAILGLSTFGASLLPSHSSLKQNIPSTTTQTVVAYATGTVPSGTHPRTQPQTTPIPGSTVLPSLQPSLQPSGHSTATPVATSGTHTGSGSVTSTPIPIAPTAVSTLTPTPQPGIGSVQINAGGAGIGSYIADTDFAGGTTSATRDTINISGVSNPAPASVYQAIRFGYTFAYTIPNLTPGASYTVRLHFAETYWTTVGKRIFNVAINGQAVLSSFDIVAAAGGADIAIVEAFTAKADSAATITIQFTSDNDQATVNAIEVLAI